jgi:phospholipid/cholesterol/gamma-HCH transport system substrate-binding protein
MKISNETKVGALTAIAITVLILGFNFLKGKNITQTDDELFAVFKSVKGVGPANPVLINGLQVGKVAALREKDKNLSAVIVTISLNKDINIPDNSVAAINSDLLGSTSLEIILGDSPNFIKSGGTLQTVTNPGLLGEVKGALSPAIDNLNKTLASLDIFIQKLNTIVDPNTKNNIQGIIANLSVASKSLEHLLNSQSGALAKTLTNLEGFTGNLAKNNSKIDSTLSNLERTTSNLANAGIDEAINDLKGTLKHLDNAISKVDSKEGTLGMLLNDRKLYDELHQTSRSLTILLDDFRTHPKRYVNISVFGRKDKSGPLKSAIYDSSSVSGNQ